jgi:transposase
MFEAAFRPPFLRKLAASTIATSNLLSQAALSETAENPVALPPLVVTATRTERSLADQPDNLFVFRGAAGDKLKIIWHDGIGMSLYAKRLERGSFIWPVAVNGVVPALSG